MPYAAAVSDDRHEMYQLEGLGGMLGFGKTPGDSGGTANNMVQAALKKVLGLDAAVRKAKNDKNLTAIGRANQLRPAQEEALDFIKLRQVLVTKALLDLDDEQAKVFAAPDLDPTDAAGALLDREIRERVAALSGEARSKLWQELGEGKHPRVMDALRRDPLPSIDRDNIELLNRSVNASESADLIAAFDRQRAEYEWARGALEAMAAKVRDGLGHGVGASA